MPRGALDASPSPTSIDWTPGGEVRLDLHRLGLSAQGLRQVGRAGLPVGQALRREVRPGARSSSGTGKSGTSPTSATGAARPRSIASSTTTPSTASGGPCRRRGSAGRTSRAASGGDVTFRDFLEHCVRGTNYATGKTGTPLDFISFHAKGAPSVRRRPRADGDRQPAPRRSTTASRSSRRFPS